MRRMMVKDLLFLTFALVCVRETPAQTKAQETRAKPDSESVQPVPATKQPAASKGDKAEGPSLDEMLAAALKGNPDIRVAEAKVHEAEAELDRVRLQVMQKVISLRPSVDGQKGAVKRAEVAYESMSKAVDNKQASQDELRLSAASLAQEKGKLAALDAEIQSLAGRVGHGFAQGGIIEGKESVVLPLSGSAFRNRLAAVEVAFSPEGKTVSAQGADGTVRVWDAQTGKLMTLFTPATGAANSAKGPMAERIRQALDKPITLKVQNGSLAEILGIIRQQAPGIPFHTVMGEEEMSRKLNLQFDSIPLGALLQAVEDSFQATVWFFVRDYGILVTSSDAPAGAVNIHNFWKGSIDGGGKLNPGWGSKSGASDGRKLPPEVEGIVKEVDEKGRVGKIGLGSDAGVSAGQTLEVYRLEPEPTYLGAVRVISVQPAESVVEQVSPFRTTIKSGDRVTSSVQKKH